MSSGTVTKVDKRKCIIRSGSLTFMKFRGPRMRSEDVRNQGGGFSILLGRILFRMNSINIGAWNIRALNDPLKQRVVHKFSFVNKLSLFFVLETRIRVNNWESLVKKFKKDWLLDANRGMDRNFRIIVLWKCIEVQVSILMKMNLLIFCEFFTAD